MSRTISKLMTREDHQFLNSSIARMAGSRQAIKAHYKKIFLDAMDAEEKLPKKSNAGRRAANTWLRETVNQKPGI